MEYAFHVYNKQAKDGATMALDKLLSVDFQAKKEKKKGAGTGLTSFSTPPVVVCIGSDLVIGDSLGPITGSMIKYKTQGLQFFLYGTLAAPVTAKEVRYLHSFLKETHKGSPVLAIDAAVGDKGDIGLIRLNDTPLRPGAGANKKLGEVGDISIMGVVAEKSVSNYGLLNTTRLGLVYSMAEIISDSVSAYLWNTRENLLKNA